MCTRKEAYQSAWWGAAPRAEAQDPVKLFNTLEMDRVLIVRQVLSKDQMEQMDYLPFDNIPVN